MTTDTDELERHARRRHHLLAELLAEQGDLRTIGWDQAFREVPRHPFVPRFYPSENGRVLTEPIDATDPRYLTAVYSDESLTTQLSPAGVPTSSSTLPSLMARMLEALDVHPGARVLEIGTGTGYNAALLTAYLGGDLVTTIDVEEAITGPARDRLAGLNLHPRVVTGDGADGWAAGAPYDRIIATCAVRSIPRAWLRQTRPGGKILATLVTGLHGYGLALLEVDAHGVGKGRILADRQASFMPMRSHADPAFQELQQKAAPQATSEPTTFQPLSLDSPGARFAVGLAMPGVTSFRMSEDGVTGLYLAHPDGSWAYARDGSVAYGGPQRLWHVAERAWRAWWDADQPTPESFTVAVTSQRQFVHTNGLVLDLLTP